MNQHVNAIASSALQNTSTMSAQLKRYDVVNTNRLRYLSQYAASHAETRNMSDAFRVYADKAEMVDDKTSRIEIEYRKDPCGRYFAIVGEPASMSLQRMPRQVRNWLIPEETLDVDIVNAAPTVLVGIFGKHGIPVPRLADFVENYHDRMMSLDANGIKDGKAFKNVMLFDTHPLCTNAPEWAFDLRREVANVWTRLVPHYEDLHEKARNVDELKRAKAEAENAKKRRRTGVGSEDVNSHRENIRGLFLHYLYQRFEGHLLMAMEDAVNVLVASNGNVSLMHDGMLVYLGGGIGVRDDSLRIVESAMESKTGIRVALAWKPIETDLTWNENFPPSEVAFRGDHKEAAEILLQRIAGQYAVDREAIFFKRGGLWIHDKRGWRSFILSSVVNMNLVKLKYDKKADEEVATPYTSVGSNASHIANIAMGMIDNTPKTYSGFARRVVLGGERKLAFGDGFYEFVDHEVRPGVFGLFRQGRTFDTFTMMDRNFPPRIQADIDCVYRTIIDPMFKNTEEGLKGVFLTALGRSVAGCLDKVTYIVHGPRSSGKSLMFQFVAQAFGQYCKSVPSAMFVARDQSHSDPFRSAAYMVEAEFARVIRLSEMPSDDGRRKVKMDGNEIKRFQSMKEGIMSNKKFNDQREYFSLATGFFLMNDIPEFTPADSMDCCHLFEFPNEFVTAEVKREDPFNANKLLADPRVEQFISEKRYQDAFIHIVLESFRPSRIVPLPSMIQAKEEAMSDQGAERYLACLEVTMDEGDFVPFTQIKAALEPFGVRDNATAMGRMLRNIIQGEFKNNSQDPPTIDKIKRQDHRKKSPTYKKQVYYYIKVRDPNDGSYATSDWGMVRERVREGRGESSYQSRREEAEDLLDARMRVPIPRGAIRDDDGGYSIGTGSYAPGFNPGAQSSNPALRRVDPLGPSAETKAQYAGRLGSAYSMPTNMEQAAEEIVVGTWKENAVTKNIEFHH